MDWADFFDTAFVIGGLSGGFIVMGIVFALVIGFVAIIKDFFVDYIIREMGGLKGLLGSLGFMLGTVLVWAGLFQVGVAIIFTLLIFITHGTIPYPSRILGMIAAGSVFLLVGGNLYWPLRHWKDFKGKAIKDKKTIIRKRESFYAWVIMWSVGAFGSYLAMHWLYIFSSSYRSALPTWMLRTHIDLPNWNEFLIAAMLGLVVMFVGYFVLRSKLKSQQERSA